MARHVEKELGVLLFKTDQRLEMLETMLSNRSEIMETGIFTASVGPNITTQIT